LPESNGLEIAKKMPSKCNLGIILGSASLEPLDKVRSKLLKHDPETNFIQILRVEGYRFSAKAI